METLPAAQGSSWSRRASLRGVSAPEGQGCLGSARVQEAWSLASLLAQRWHLMSGDGLFSCPAQALLALFSRPVIPRHFPGHRQRVHILPPPTSTFLRHLPLPLGPSKCSHLPPGATELSPWPPHPALILFPASACSFPGEPTCIPESQGFPKVPGTGPKSMGLLSLQACFSPRTQEIHLA